MDQGGKLTQPVQVEETHHYEFKEIKGINPIDSIQSIADQYVVAFLNSEGNEYIGVFEMKIGCIVDPKVRFSRSFDATNKKLTQT